MTYEYKIVAGATLGKVEYSLNAYAADGWRVVEYVYSTGYREVLMERELR